MLSSTVLMRHSGIFFWISCSAFFSLGAVARSEFNCSTTGCHQNYTQKSVLHRPLRAKGCHVCHTVSPEGVAPAKPADHPKLLPIEKKEINASCAACHDTQEIVGGTHAVIHAPIRDESCVACHDPHASDFKHLLRSKPGSEQCMQCHEKMEHVLSQKSAHSPVLHEKAACLNCHTPHVSNHSKLLKKSEKQTCLECHGRDAHFSEQLARKGSVHSPVAKGECSACHSAHGSEHTALLKKKFNPALYVRNSDAEFALCMSCHKEKTQFRQEDRDLHALHLAPKGRRDGRGCMLCHESHASTQAALIRTQFVVRTEGGRELTAPMSFQRTEHGGTCTVACHGSQSYERTH